MHGCYQRCSRQGCTDYGTKQKNKRRCRGSNPGRPRDRRKYSPLCYNDFLCHFESLFSFFVFIRPHLTAEAKVVREDDAKASRWEGSRSEISTDMLCVSMLIFLMTRNAKRVVRELQISFFFCESKINISVCSRTTRLASK